MNPLLRKEIRLLAPSLVVAVLLALPPICTRSDDQTPVFLLFMGLAMMALTSIGRETSLNTFSSFLAQPIERTRLWKIKLSVLSLAFLIVFAVWRLAILFSFKEYGGHPADPDDSAGVLISGTLVFVSTFASGLWATLLLRQVAGAFWLTLLTPAVLAGFTAAFFAENHSDNFIAVMFCLVLGIYSLGGFIFARWLFFRAQDVGWTGGIISLPDWNIIPSRSALASTIRSRKPIFALVKKEFQLQQVPLMGALGLLVLHTGIIIWRAHHPFAPRSAAETLTSIFWMLWLILPVMVGSMAISEERRLGMMEAQLCLPVSRRIHFAIKASLTLIFGIVLGGVLPMVLESIGRALSGKTLVFLSSDDTFLFWFQLDIVGLAATLTLISFFGSSLAKNFLQAIGFAIVSYIGCASLLSTFMNGRMFFFDTIPTRSILLLTIAVPTLIITFPWLAYLNYKNFRPGWPLWRRNLLGFAGAVLFVIGLSASLYQRPWEVFEPAEPAHGAPKLSLADAPRLTYFYPIQVRLPDGRVWVCPLRDFQGRDNPENIREFFNFVFSDPFPYSAGEQTFITGSNWLSIITQTTWVTNGEHLSVGIGIHLDGTLWFSTNSINGKRMGAEICLDPQPNWQQITLSSVGLFLLKKDGTLWHWPGYYASLYHPETATIRDLVPVSPDDRWKELFSEWPGYARRSDDTVWSFNQTKIQGQETFQLRQAKYMEGVSFKTLLHSSHGLSYVGPDGTPRILVDNPNTGTPTWLIGQETNCQQVVGTYNTITALNTDGSLWQWDFQHSPLEKWNGTLPNRLGIHNDWVAIASGWNGLFTLAADGGLWFWPDRGAYEYTMLLKFPKQPRKIANLFDSN